MNYIQSRQFGKFDGDLPASGIGRFPFLAFGEYMIRFLASFKFMTVSLIPCQHRCEPLREFNTCCYAKWRGP
jgi:hypothetical protein